MLESETCKDYERENLEYKKNKIPITQGKLERLKLKAEKQLELVFGINLKKLREVMNSDDISDFMQAID
jgi:hypothetical protein